VQHSKCKASECESSSQEYPLCEWDVENIYLDFIIIFINNLYLLFEIKDCAMWGHTVWPYFRNDIKLILITMIIE